MTDNIFLDPNSSLYKGADDAILKLEREFCAEVLFGGIVRSHAMGLDNATSDVDLHVVFARRPKESGRFLSHAHVMFDFDWICKEIGHLRRCNMPFEGELYPSYEHRDKKDLKNILIDDNDRGIIFRILFSRQVFDGKNYIKNNTRAIGEYLRVTRILDSCYTRASIYRDNYLTDTPYLRIYLYALHELLSAEWVILHNTIPPMRFSELLKTCSDQQVQREVPALLELNKQPVDRSDMTVRKNSVLDRYILNRLNALRDDLVLIAADKPDMLLTAL